MSIVDTMNLRRLMLRVRSLLTRRRAERDLVDELAFHLERETRAQIARGVEPAEARRRAQVRFGSMAAAADECRDERSAPWIDHLVRDLLYAWRAARRAPLAALTIVTTVGLGLGLVAAVYTILNALIFKVDEVRDPRELFAVERVESAIA